MNACRRGLSAPAAPRRPGQLPHPQTQAEIAGWLASPRSAHFTPTYSSWLNLIEVFFGIITRQAIRRGSFDSVKDLVTAISRFIDGWNDRCHPFTWTKTADEILPHATRKRNSDAAADLVSSRLRAPPGGSTSRRRASSRVRRRPLPESSP